MSAPRSEFQLDLEIANLLEERGHLPGETGRVLSSDAGDVIGEVLERLSASGRLDALEDLHAADLPLELADRLGKWLRRAEDFTVRTAHATLRITESTSGDLPETRRLSRPEVELPPWYEVRGLLGRGGMGAVYEARDRDLHRTVAIKVMNVFDEDATRRFVAELRATVRLEHPNILPVYTADRDGLGRPYYVMKKVEGTSLSNAREGRPLEDLVRIVAAAARAVAYAHAKGFLHRDLKPDNIMVGERGEVWVVDWGLVHADPSLSTIDLGSLDRSEPASRLTLTGYMMGTLGYAAPEQIQGVPREVAEPADVHGLGATLYEILTGRRPYQGSSTHEVVQKVVKSRPPHPGPGVPAELASVAMRALEKDPDRRHPTAALFAADLEAWLAGHPVPSHRYPPLQRIGLWIRNHPVATVGCSLVFLGLFSLVLVRAGRLRLEAAAAETFREERVKSLRERAAGALARIAPAREEAGRSHEARLAALGTYGEPYLRIWEDPYEADRELEALGPPYPEGNADIAAADREWRIAAATIENLLTALERVREEAAGLADLEIAELAALRLESKIQELAWALARARFLEDATIDSRSVDALRKTALLDPEAEGLAPCYVEVLSLWRDIPESDPYRAEVESVLAARATLRIGPRRPGTAARLVEFVTTDNPFGRRVVDPEVPLEGKTYELPLGSYLLEVETGERPEDLVAFPRLLERSRIVEIEVDLPQEIPDGLVYVTPGAWIAGGEGHMAWARHRAIMKEGFFIARFEVTFDEYIAFLKEVVGEDASREGLVPRSAFEVNETPRALVDTATWTLIPRMADRGPLPATSMTHLGAAEYARWMTKRGGEDGLSYGLPGVLEFGYVLRGSDGRQFAWGDRWGPLLANVGSTERLPARGGSYPSDRSLFGVYDLSGNVGEWTSAPVPADPGSMHVCGSNWSAGQAWARAGAFTSQTTASRTPCLGFRVMARR